MSRISLSVLRLGIFGALITTLGACSSSVNLPDPTFINFIDTTELYALRGTSVPTASAFDIVRGFPARMELGDAFDFAFDFDDSGTATIVPGRTLGIPVESGVQIHDGTFNDLILGPLEDYIEDSIMTVDVNTVFAARSRLAADFCSAFLGALPRYAKFNVIAIDPNVGTITLEYMVNFNCGYRSLAPGIPER